MKHTLHALALAAATLACSLAQADTGKLLLTGGVSSVDGAAGGGLTPWAVIGSNATEGEIGGTAHLSRLSTKDYGLTAIGAAVGFKDRVEVSLAQQDFNASPAIALNGIAAFGVTPGQHIKMDVLGVKFKVAGDAVLDSDTLMPQIAVGLEHKRASPGSIQSVYNFLGVQNSGTDLYVSATKLFLAQSVLASGTLRLTKANQFGLLGFGGDKSDSYSAQFEGSLAYLFSRKFALGAEFRTKPDNLGFAAEDEAFDVFGAYFLNKNASLTLAYVDLGGIALQGKQRGLYLSLQAGF